MAARIFRNPNFLVGFVIVIVIAVGAIAFGVWQTNQEGGQEAVAASTLYARVHDGDGNTTDVPLNVNGKRNIRSSLGTNVLDVEDGSVHVESATCQNKDCVHQGSISQPGQQIICLPNKMWIEIVHEGDADGKMDATKTPGYAGSGSSSGSGSGSSIDATAR